MYKCLVFLISIGFVLSSDEDPKLRFYYSSYDRYTELPLQKAKDIFSLTWYNKNKSTIFFAHGFTGKPTGPAVTAVIKAYIEQEDYNVVLLNWEYLASARNGNIANSYLNWAAPNARKLGDDFAKALSELFKEGLIKDTTQLIGHSLGSHIFGIAGNRLADENIQLPWITGLDPASIGFENKPLDAKLHSGSAKYVEIIHSDPSKYGYKRAHGTVDFWPNYHARGPVQQPGCQQGSFIMFEREDLCSHNRSWQLYIDALKYPGTLIGSYAQNYRTWKNYSHDERITITAAICVYDLNTVPGDYYLVTKENSPFGKGNDGL